MTWLSYVKNLIRLMGMDEAARLFHGDINLSERRKGNYHELTLNYYTLLFNRSIDFDLFTPKPLVKSRIRIKINEITGLSRARDFPGQGRGHNET